jgi:hypothetical protein
MGKFIMNNKEREQLKVFSKLKAKEITRGLAAQMLKITPKWLREKFKRYMADGDEGLVHRGRGKASPNRWNADDCAFSLERLRSEWQGFGPTFTVEKLEQLYGKKVSKETMRKTMIAHNIQYDDRRKKGKQRKRRERKEIVGIMVQLDGSPHDWFEGRGPKCTLLVFIDDATSRILWLEFVESESLHGVMGATRRYMEKHDKPVSFYVDYGSVFSVNKNNKDHEKITQFERAMGELGVEIIHARSPQAKGRVERCNRTMQDRLIKEMRLAGISNMQDANRFVQEGFIANHNAKFAEEAAKPGNAHLSVEDLNLSNIFCIKTKRVVMNDYTISYRRRAVQILKTRSILVRPKDQIFVYEHLDGSLSLVLRKINLEFVELGLKKRNKLSPVEHVEELIKIDSASQDIGNNKKRNFSSCQDGQTPLASGLSNLEQAHKAALDLQASSI